VKHFRRVYGEGTVRRTWPKLDWKLLSFDPRRVISIVPSQIRHGKTQTDMK
jgi:hypothetical protein